MKIICRDRQKASAPQGRALSSVAADINRLLSPKTYEQLQTLEVQVKRKLNSNEPIDTDYWEELLRSLTVWKARARLRNVYQDVIDERVRDLRKQQKAEAESIREKLAPLAPVVSGSDQPQASVDCAEFKGLDPDPLLHVRQEDKGLEIMDETAFLRQVVSYPRVTWSKTLLLTLDIGSRTSKDPSHGIRPPPTTRYRKVNGCHY
jgi:hypothetical protein